MTKGGGGARTQCAIAAIGDALDTELPNHKEAATDLTFPTKDIVRDFRRKGFRLL